ncbi:MAG: glycosyltransferase family 4 protein [Acidimicrobiales bacterium]|jgi:glycosyltransferase involved in cell wall biosynthesis
MRVSFVVPRYGPTIIGGAETAARALAEHLVEGKGWEVEVLTGCAQDFVTWAEVVPPGEEVINGVRVVRFAARAGRDPSFHPFSASLLADPGRASLADAERWIDLQGPVLPDLVDAALHSEADALIFYPYLYYPTVRLIDRARVPTILHPAAHDEPALRLPVFGRVFGSADGLVFQTAAERDLVQGRFPVASHRQLLLGLGVDDPGDGPDACGEDAPDAPAAGLASLPSRAGDPYLVCLGRVDRNKGTWLLVELFSAYKQRHPGPLRLVLAGPVVDAPAEHPDIDVVGPVSERQKWALLHGAIALVSPSPWEAFSLVIAESWSAGTPVVVNAGCAATVEHCRRSGAGLSFAGFGEFEAVVDRLYRDEGLRARLGGRGRAYVDRWFRWPRVIDRYAAFVESVAATA